MINTKKYRIAVILFSILLIIISIFNFISVIKNINYCLDGKYYKIDLIGITPLADNIMFYIYMTILSIVFFVSAIGNFLRYEWSRKLTKIAILASLFITIINFIFTIKKEMSNISLSMILFFLIGVVMHIGLLDFFDIKDVKENFAKPTSST